jgi:hypothetical protein
MRIQLACFIAVTALACGGTSTLDAGKLDADGARDGSRAPSSDAAEPADARSLTDSTTTSAPESGPSTEASSPVPDGSSPDVVLTTDAASDAAPVGASCVPSEEEAATFSGFSVTEVGLGSKTSACATQVCLVNHFQGRTTCPYGQNASGQGPGTTQGCSVPETRDPVTVEVPPQLSCRKAAEAVYCSCRCANADGKTDDGATYCSCPDTMACVQLVAALGDNESLNSIAGAYCVKTGTEYGLDGSMCSSTCNPTATACP